MATNRRQKTPILHRIRSEQLDQQLHRSPNIYTKQYERDKRFKQSTSRGSLARSKYKKALQSKGSYQNQNQADKIKLLIIENSELRKQIVELKVQQFYQFDDKKLKELLIQVENLKKQLKKCKQSLKQSQIQNDFLRRTNAERKVQTQKLQRIDFSKKQYKDNTLNTMAMSPRNMRQDEELTERIIQKPVIFSSNPYDDFQDCRKLLESKSTNKKDRIKKPKQTQHEHLLLLQSKNRILDPTSPRNSEKPRLSTSPRDRNDLFYITSKEEINSQRKMRSEEQQNDKYLFFKIF